MTKFDKETRHEFLQKTNKQQQQQQKKTKKWQKILYLSYYTVQLQAWHLH